MPRRSTAVALAHASPSPTAVRLLRVVRSHPGRWTAAELARARGWDVDVTQEDARELRALGRLAPHDAVQVRGELTAWSYRDVDERLPEARAVCMALADGWRRVEDLSRETGMDRRVVTEALATLADAGLCWPLGRLVEVGGG